MTARTVQLVLHYDGTAFFGWQVQPDQRTVQGELERVLARMCDTPIRAQAAGRTDTGVHARGQAVGVKVPPKWEPAALRRALNALLPRDVWVESAHEMGDDFHARYSALSRRYTYCIGTDEGARSPFRRSWEWAAPRVLDRAALDAAASDLLGEHTFLAFAVRGTAPPEDDHRCRILEATWSDRPGGVALGIRANRFLHHMVRFLVGTMVDIASGRRDPGDLARLLAAGDNTGTSVPAPPHGLFLDHVEYPRALYISPP